MYAVIKAGGKQHRVKPGDVIEVELMHAKDDAVQFQPLLVVDDDNKTHVGKEIAKAVVTGKLVGEQKGEKIKVFKYRNKTGYARHTGHRQMYTLVEIGEIKLPGRPAAKKADEAKAAAESAEDKAAADKPAAKSTAAKSAASKTAAAKAAAAAADEEDAAAAADAAPAETPPAEVAEVAAEAETGPDTESETEAQAEAEAAE
jgi:large subunit ribosomal protein L21